MAPTNHHMEDRSYSHSLSPPPVSRRAATNKFRSDSASLSYETSPQRPAVLRALGEPQDAANTRPWGLGGHPYKPISSIGSASPLQFPPRSSSWWRAATNNAQGNSAGSGSAVGAADGMRRPSGLPTPLVLPPDIPSIAGTSSTDGSTFAGHVSGIPRSPRQSSVPQPLQSNSSRVAEESVRFGHTSFSHRIIPHPPHDESSPETGSSPRFVLRQQASNFSQFYTPFTTANGPFVGIEHPRSSLDGGPTGTFGRQHPPHSLPPTATCTTTDERAVGGAVLLESVGGPRNFAASFSSARQVCRVPPPTSSSGVPTGGVAGGVAGVGVSTLEGHLHHHGSLSSDQSRAAAVVSGHSYNGAEGISFRSRVGHHHHHNLHHHGSQAGGHHQEGEAAGRCSGGGDSDHEGQKKDAAADAHAVGSGRCNNIVNMAPNEDGGELKPKHKSWWSRLLDARTRLLHNIELGFRALGFFVYDRPCTIIFATLLVYSVLSLGILFMKPLKDLDVLFADYNTPGLRNKRELEAIFGRFPETSVMLLLSNVKNSTGHYEGILTARVLEGLTKVEEFVRKNITVYSDSGKPYTFEDLCYKIPADYGETECDVQSIRDVYRFPQHFGKPISTRHWPYVINARRRRILRANVYLGGTVTTSTTGGLTRLLNATAFLILYNTRSDGEYEGLSEKWQYRFNDFLVNHMSRDEETRRFDHADWGPTSFDREAVKSLRIDDVEIQGQSASAWDDELYDAGRLSKSQILDMGVVTVFMLVYSWLVTGTRDWFKTKSFVASFGPVTALIGILAGYGVCYACSIKHCVTIMVCPFLALGVSMDDMFVLLNAYSLSYVGYSGSRERCAAALGEAGLAMTMTTLTNIICFGVGFGSPYTGIRNFCIVTAAALFFGYIAQFTFLFPLLCLESIREENRYLVPFCGKHADRWARIVLSPILRNKTHNHDDDVQLEDPGAAYLKKRIQDPSSSTELLADASHNKANYLLDSCGKNNGGGNHYLMLEAPGADFSEKRKTHQSALPLHSIKDVVHQMEDGVKFGGQGGRKEGDEAAEVKSFSSQRRHSLEENELPYGHPLARLSVFELSFTIVRLSDVRRRWKKFYESDPELSSPAAKEVLREIKLLRQYEEPPHSVGGRLRQFFCALGFCLQLRLLRLLILAATLVLVGFSVKGIWDIRLGLSIEDVYLQRSWLRRTFQNSVDRFDSLFLPYDMYMAPSKVSNKHSVPNIPDPYLRDLLQEKLVTFRPLIDQRASSIHHLPRVIKWWTTETRDQLLDFVERLNALDYTSDTAVGMKHFYEEQEEKLTEPYAINNRTRYYEILYDFCFESAIGANLFKNFVFDENSGALLTFRFLLFPRSSNRAENFLNHISEFRKVEKEFEDYWFTGESGIQLPMRETDMRLPYTTTINLGCAILAATLVASLLLESLTSALLLIFVILLTDICVLGTMFSVNLQFNIVTVTMMVLSIGFAVDYTMHVTHSFSACVGRTRSDRMRETVVMIGGPVIHGAVSTCVALVAALKSQEYLLVVTFKTVSLILLFGCVFAVFVLPTILSFFARSETKLSRSFSQKYQSAIHRMEAECESDAAAGTASARPAAATTSLAVSPTNTATSPTARTTTTEGTTSGGERDFAAREGASIGDFGEGGGESHVPRNLQSLSS